MGPDSVFKAGRSSLPGAGLAAPHKSGGRRVKSWPDDTQTNTLQSFGCHKQINKKQTSTRCNHTHDTHWVHLKCTHIQQRQYKPDWRCTIHAPTQNITTTPNTNNTTSPSQTNHHPLTNNKSAHTSTTVNTIKSQTPYHSQYITPKQHSPKQPVVPWPNSEQTNVPYYTHNLTQSTKTNTHHHYALFADWNHTQQYTCSTALT